VNDNLKAFPIANAKLATSASAQSTNSFQYPGTTPAISSNGTANGIVWAVENSSPAILHAYDATSLQEIYKQQPSCEWPGSVRQWQQVHRTADCEWEGFCWDA
jgi:hypothetical protein